MATFLTLKQFGELHLVKSLDIKPNHKTKKIFASVDGQVMKVQQDIDTTQPMSILVEDDGDPANLNDCCLVNYTPTETIATVQLI